MKNRHIDGSLYSQQECVSAAEFSLSKTHSCGETPNPLGIYDTLQTRGDCHG